MYSHPEDLKFSPGGTKLYASLVNLVQAFDANGQPIQNGDSGNLHVLQVSTLAPLKVLGLGFAELENSLILNNQYLYVTAFDGTIYPSTPQPTRSQHRHHYNSMALRGALPPMPMCIWETNSPTACALYAPDARPHGTAWTAKFSSPVLHTESLFFQRLLKVKESRKREVRDAHFQPRTLFVRIVRCFLSDLPSSIYSLPSRSVTVVSVAIATAIRKLFFLARVPGLSDGGHTGTPLEPQSNNTQPLWA